MDQNAADRLAAEHPSRAGGKARPMQRLTPEQGIKNAEEDLVKALAAGGADHITSCTVLLIKAVNGEIMERMFAINQREYEDSKRLDDLERRIDARLDDLERRIDAMKLNHGGMWTDHERRLDRLEDRPTAPTNTDPFDRWLEQRWAALSAFKGGLQQLAREARVYGIREGRNQCISIAKRYEAVANDNGRYEKAAGAAGVSLEIEAPGTILDVTA